MKTHSARRPHGFTLVELLVVIAIIAVLAGAGFAAGNAAIQKAKKTTALASAIAIESAVNNFYTEYGTMPAEPVPTSAVDTKPGSTGMTMIKVLLGTSDAASLALNPRSIKFLSVKEGKANKNGLIYTGTGSTQTVSGLFDPWGGPYHIALDDNYDEIVQASPSAGGGVTLNGRRVVAWSNGADGVSGSGGKTGDDVKTW
jgi:prepilin-type N-terminal cleavage/methylation domain-containing protein